MKSRRIRIAVGIVLLLVLIVYVAVFARNREVFDGEKVKTDETYSLIFSKMNGRDSHVFSLSQGDILEMDILFEEGRTDISVGIDGKEPIYVGNDAKEGNFSVVIPEDGEYTVLVNASFSAGHITVSVMRAG